MAGECPGQDTDQSGAFFVAAGVEPGEYKLVAVPGLTDIQKWDATFVQRYGSADVTLNALESRTVDVKVRNSE